MKITEIAVHRPVATMMVFLIVIVLGAMGLRFLPVDLLPPIEYPQLTIRTNYPNVGPEEIERIRRESAAAGVSLHDALMRAAGWPEVEPDGKLLMSHQDALLMGGKVQAAPGYADHVTFADPDLCAACREQVCIEACSGQASLWKGVHATDQLAQSAWSDQRVGVQQQDIAALGDLDALVVVDGGVGEAGDKRGRGFDAGHAEGFL